MSYALVMGLQEGVCRICHRRRAELYPHVCERCMAREREAGGDAWQQEAAWSGTLVRPGPNGHHSPSTDELLVGIIAEAMVGLRRADSAEQVSNIRKMSFVIAERARRSGKSGNRSSKGKSRSSGDRVQRDFALAERILRGCSQSRGEVRGLPWPS